MKTFLATASVIALLTGCAYEPRVHEIRAPLSGDLIRTIEGPSDEAGGVRVSGVQTFDRWGRPQDSQFFAGPGMGQTTLGAAIGAGGFVAGSMGGAALLRPSKVSTTTTLSQTGATVSNLATSAGSTANATGGAGGKGGAGGTGGTVGPITALGGNATGGSANANAASKSSSASSSWAKQTQTQTQSQPKLATVSTTKDSKTSTTDLNKMSRQFHEKDNEDQKKGQKKED